MADKFIFGANNGTTGNELWVSDGSPEGTKLLKDIYPGATWSNFGGLAATGDGRAIFYANEPSKPSEIWITDGSAAGTRVLADPDPSSDQYADPFYYTPLGKGTFVFSGSDKEHGRELWRTDLTATGTKLVLEIQSGFTDADPIFGGPFPKGSNPSEFTPLGNGKVLFSAFDDQHRNELWITDGTAGGTKLLKNINPDVDGETFGSTPDHFTKLPNGKFLFVAADGASSGALWITDGTSAGTRLVKDVNWTRVGGADQPSVVLPNGKMVFAAAPQGNSLDFELWVSDGTSPGTHLLKEIRPGTTYDDASTPAGFKLFGDKALFSATNADKVRQLWITDGTSGGTTLLSAAATVPNSFTRLGDGRAVFAATDPTHGNELWITDGTTKGTKLVANINANSAGSSPTGFFTLSDGRVLFSADDGVSGRELWVTNGTAAGTKLFKDINPGTTGSSPNGLFSLLPVSAGSAPTALKLSASSVAENVKSGTLVGALQVTDDDTGDTFTFKLLDDAGERFGLKGSSLVVKDGLKLDYEQARSDTVTVQVTDSQGHKLDKVLTIALKDVNQEKVTGDGRANTILGGAKADTLSGAGGNDTLKGGKGADKLTGGTGADKLYAGADKDTDTFVFAKGDSGKTAATWDQVFDFRADTDNKPGKHLAGADLIDLHLIDADGAKGDQALRFVEKFTTAAKNDADGQVRVVDAGSHVTVEVDWNGDKHADMILQVMNVAKLTADDFLL